MIELQLKVKRLYLDSCLRIELTSLEQSFAISDLTNCPTCRVMYLLIVGTSMHSFATLKRLPLAIAFPRPLREGVRMYLLGRAA